MEVPMRSLKERIFQTNDIPAFCLVRLALGAVFVLAGVQKLGFSAGAIERFQGLGFPVPEFTLYFVAICELLGGLLVLVGFATRLAAVPLAITMLVAIATTKLGLLSKGFWEFAPAVRLDALLLLLAVLVIINGSDRVSLDYFMKKR
jgi:uncharacterized membrane protein YphA (DoxX/SURF4 family)